MSESLNKYFVTADVCKAIDDRLTLTDVFTVQGLPPIRIMAYGLTAELADLVKIDLNEFSKAVSLNFENITTFSLNRVERFFIRVEALGSNAVGLVPVSLSFGVRK